MDSKKKLFEAIKNNDLEKVKYLLEQGANLHDENEEALQRAAENGHLEVVKYLLESELIFTLRTTKHSYLLQKMAI